MDSEHNPGREFDPNHADFMSPEYNIDGSGEELRRLVSELAQDVDTDDCYTDDSFPALMNLIDKESDRRDYEDSELKLTVENSVDFGDSFGLDESNQELEKLVHELESDINVSPDEQSRLHTPFDYSQLDDDEVSDVSDTLDLELTESLELAIAERDRAYNELDKFREKEFQEKEALSTALKRVEAEKENQITELNLLVENKRQQEIRLNELLASSTEKITRLEEDLHEYAKAHEELNISNNVDVQQNDEHTSSEINSRLLELEEELSKSRKDYYQLESLMVREREEKKELEARLDNLLSSSEGKIAGLEKELEEGVGAIEELKRINEGQLQEKHVRNEMLHAAELKTSELEKDLLDWQKRLTEFESDASNNLAEIESSDELKNRLSELEYELEQRRNDYKELERLRLNETEEKNQLDIRFNDLLLSSNKKIERLERELEENAVAIEELKRLNENELERSRSAAELDSRENLSRNFRIVEAEKEKRISELDLAIKNKNQLYSDLEELHNTELQENRLLKEKLQTIESKSLQLEKDIAERDRRLTELNELYLAEKESVGKSSQVEDNLKNRLTELENELELRRRSYTELEIKHESERRTLQNIANGFRENIIEKDILISELTEKEENAKNAFQSMESNYLAECDSRKRELQENSERVTAREVQIAGLVEELANARRKTDELAGSLSEKTSTYDIVISELTEKEEKAKTAYQSLESKYQTECDSRKRELQEADERISARETQIAGLVEELADAKRESDELARSLSEKTAEHDVLLSGFTGKEKNYNTAYELLQSKYLAECETRQRELQEMGDRIAIRESQVARLGEELTDEKKRSQELAGSLEILQIEYEARQEAIQESPLTGDGGVDYQGQAIFHDRIMNELTSFKEETSSRIAELEGYMRHRDKVHADLAQLFVEDHNALSANAKSGESGEGAGVISKRFRQLEGAFTRLLSIYADNQKDNLKRF